MNGLYELAVPTMALLSAVLDNKIVFHPWPHWYTGVGWRFKVNIKHASPAEAMKEMETIVGADNLKSIG